MSEKKKVLFVNDNLAMGGVTKVMADLLDVLDYSKYDVDLLILHYEGDMKVHINDNVNIIKGDATYRSIDKTIGAILREKNVSALLSKLWLVFLLKTGLIKPVIKRSRRRMLTKRYDTEIAFNDGFTEVFVANGDSDRKIAWFHIAIYAHNDSAKYKTLIRESLAKMDLGVGVSDQAAQSYKDIYGIENTCTIYNMIDVESVKKKAQEPLDVPYSSDTVNLISVGRLCDQKNYERFARVHKKLVDEGYRIHSYVVGDGPNKEGLMNLIATLGIEDSFTLLGRQDNPYPYIQQADLFVFSSRYEGFGVAAYESLILGVPCVSTDVADVRKHIGNEYGCVTENTDDGLYNGVKALLDPDKRAQYKENLKTYTFDTQAIIRQIHDVI